MQTDLAVLGNSLDGMMSALNGFEFVLAVFVNGKAGEEVVDADARRIRPILLLVDREKVILAKELVRLFEHRGLGKDSGTLARFALPLLLLALRLIGWPRCALSVCSSAPSLIPYLFAIALIVR